MVALFSFCVTTFVQLMSLPLSSSLPLYIQIREALRAKILDGTYAAQERLPSEHEMIDAFGVSRITVRQAMNDLQKEGLLFKVHGKGAFVAMPKVSQELMQLQGFGEAMQLQGHEAHSVVFGLATVQGSDLACAKLGIAAGSAVTEIKRVRYLNRDPVSVDHSWVRHEVGARLTEKNLCEKDLFFLLENELQQPLHSADLEIEATSADADVARRLKVAHDAPILRIERLTFAAEALPLVFEYLHYPAGRFRYRMKIRR